MFELREINHVSFRNPYMRWCLFVILNHTTILLYNNTKLAVITMSKTAEFDFVSIFWDGSRLHHALPQSLKSLLYIFNDQIFVTMNLNQLILDNNIINWYTYEIGNNVQAKMSGWASA